MEEVEEEAEAAGKLWSSGGESLTLRRAATSSSTVGPGRCSGRRGLCCSTKASTPSFSAFYDTAPLQLAPATPLLGILGVGRFLETVWLATENCEDTTDSKHLT